MGAYHIHTVFSDGHKHPDDIASIAADLGLDFIILTDHGSPNKECLASEGWKHGVLVLAGSELSVSRGHLVGLDFRIPPTVFPQNADQAARMIDDLDGISIIAHPYSKTQWSWGDMNEYSGIEIINADSMLKKDILRWLPYLPAIFFKPELSILKMLTSPERNLRKWDEMNRRRPVFGYFSTDAHFFYRALLSSLRLHVLLESPLSPEFEEAKQQVFDALRNGRFYNAVESAARADGLRFWAQAGDRTVEMGGYLILREQTFLKIQKNFLFETETRLIHDGATLLKSNEDMISFKAEAPGSYRVEIYIKEKTPLGMNVPWIVANPIHLKREIR